MAKDLAVILNNGSLNSLVTTALAAQKCRTVMLFVETSANPASRQRCAFDQQVAHFKPYRDHVITMPFLGELQSQSAAVAQAADLRQSIAVAPQLLDLLPLAAAALRFAANYQACSLYLGLRVGSSADELAQATEYVQVLGELVQLPCAQPELEVVAPLLELDPWQVVDTAFQVKAPLELGWSCIHQGVEPCWNCRGCRIRQTAFEQAGKADPLHAARK